MYLGESIAACSHENVWDVHSLSSDVSLRLLKLMHQNFNHNHISNRKRCKDSKRALAHFERISQDDSNENSVNNDSKINKRFLMQGLVSWAENGFQDKDLYKIIDPVLDFPLTLEYIHEAYRKTCIFYGRNIEYSPETLEKIANSQDLYQLVKKEESYFS